MYTQDPIFTQKIVDFKFVESRQEYESTCLDTGENATSSKNCAVFDTRNLTPEKLIIYYEVQVTTFTTRQLHCINKSALKMFHVLSMKTDRVSASGRLHSHGDPPLYSQRSSGDAASSCHGPEGWS